MSDLEGIFLVSGLWLLACVAVGYFCYGLGGRNELRRHFCVVCGRMAPLVDRECPECRH